MPDAVPPVPESVRAVPHRLRLVCALTAAVIVAVMVVVGLLLTHSSTGVVSFHTSDQVAMVVLGLILGGGILTLGRSRVDADARGIRVRNIVMTHALPWEMVRAVRFERRSAWATLLLANGDELALLAVQAGDGERAVVAVEGLRALLDAARVPEPPKPPLLYED